MTIKTLVQRHWLRSVATDSIHSFPVSIVDFEQVNGVWEDFRNQWFCRNLFRKTWNDKMILSPSTVRTVNTHLPRSIFLLTPRTIEKNMIIKMKNGSTVADKKNWISLLSMNHSSATLSSDFQPVMIHQLRKRST